MLVVQVLDDYLHLSLLMEDRVWVDEFLEQVTTGLRVNVNVKRQLESLYLYLRLISIVLINRIIQILFSYNKTVWKHNFLIIFYFTNKEVLTILRQFHSIHWIFKLKTLVSLSYSEVHDNQHVFIVEVLYISKKFH